MNKPKRRQGPGFSRAYRTANFSTTYDGRRAISLSRNTFSVLSRYR
jgi:hypothetical protein